MTTKSVVLITGASQGLGYFAAQQLASTGEYHVLVGSRDLAKARDAAEKLTASSSGSKDFEAIEIDVTSDTSISAAAKHVEEKYGRLDMLLNNAGITTDHTSASTTSNIRATYHSLYDTNLFGAVATTEMFLPLLHKGSRKRIAFTSSGLGSLKWAHDSSDIMSAVNLPIYRSTKTALNMVMLHYARLLESDGFVVCAADPGYCSTNLTSFVGGRPPTEGAEVLVRALLDGKEDVHAAVIDEAGKEPW
jgi:NAD(P)-dependent dehydrogenase (short-subunit alcohol dehydrogenase family)